MAIHDLPVSAKAVIEGLLTMKGGEHNMHPGGILGASGGEVMDGEMGAHKSMPKPGGAMRGEDKGTPSLTVTQMQEMDVHHKDTKIAGDMHPEEPSEFDVMIKKYKDMGLPGDQARLRALYRLSER